MTIRFAFIKFFILAVVGVAVNAHAECTLNGCIASGSDPIKNIYLTAISDGQVYIEAPSGRENLDCTLAEGRFLMLRSTHPLFKEIYATLLAGVMADKTLWLRIKNGSAKCEINYIQLRQ